MMVPAARQTILIVDDEPLVLQTMEMLLAFDGHHVEAASNGESALEKFAIQDFDIVFADQRMPNMSGEALAIAIKKLSPHQIVVMVSGNAEPVVQKTGEQEFIDFTLQKPFLLHELREIVQKVTLKKAVKVPEFSFEC